MKNAFRALLFGAVRALERVERLRMAFLYMGVGTLRLGELRAAIAESWDDFNDTALDVDSGLMLWEQSFVSRFVAPGSRVLLVGSGSGRDLLALAKMGCTVVGVEPAAKAARRARQFAAERNIVAAFVDGYFEEAALPGEFDVVIFSYFCYSYIPVSARRVAALAKARTHLSHGGRIVVSFLFRDDPPRGRVIALARMAGAITRSDWHLEPGDAIGRAPVTWPACSYEHIFGPGEIEREAGAAGLRVAGRGGHPHNEPWIVFEVS